MEHDWRVHPVDCPARRKGQAMCHLGNHANSYKRHLLEAKLRKLRKRKRKKRGVR